MSQEKIEDILQKYRVIAVAGLSRDKDKPSYRVAEYMKAHDYQIIHVTPFVDEVLGEKSYNSLPRNPFRNSEEIDTVDIFRRPNNVPFVVEEAAKLKIANGKPYVIWV